MEKIIKAATEEYKQNGRNDIFLMIEDKVLEKKNPLQIYYFARYAKGADVAKCQKAMLECADLEYCFYFQQFVPGSNLGWFINKAVAKQDVFWLNKFIQLVQRKINLKDINYGSGLDEMEAQSKEILRQIEDCDKRTRDLMIQFRQERSMLGYTKQEAMQAKQSVTEELQQYSKRKHELRSQIKDGKSITEINITKQVLIDGGVSDSSMKFIEDNNLIKGISSSRGKDNISYEVIANEIYSNRGACDKYKEVEKAALYHFGNDNAFLFAKYAPSVSLRDFERVALLKGDPFYMFLLATEVQGINKELMLHGMEISKWDYRQNEQQLKRQIATKSALNASIENNLNNLNRTTDEHKIVELKRQIKADTAKREKISAKVPERIADINVRWMPVIERLIRTNSV